MIYLVGLIVGIALMFLLFKLNGTVKLNKWYDWLLGVVIIVLVSVGGQHYASSMAGYEPKAAWIGSALFFGLALILAGLEWRLLSARKNA